MLWLLVVLPLLAFSFYLVGRVWVGSKKRPPLKDKPLVSFLIPAYKSEKTIRECIESVLRLDYPKKEIIVVNDYPDRTPQIAQKLGAKVINKKERQGKAKSLNEAAKTAKGKILFFLDSDTIIREDSLKKVVPWFTDKKIGVVAPRYIAMNTDRLFSRFVSMENSYNSTIFKMHMQFGSMLSFRGCGIAIRASTFRKLGGWAQTLIEDSDFAIRIMRSGLRTQYEPEAIVETYEPETFSELKKQKLRWGRGSGYAIFNNKGSYVANKQVIFNFVPYFIIVALVFLSLFAQIFSITQMIVFYTQYPFLFFMGAFYYFLYLLLIVYLSLVMHNAILIVPERLERKDILYTPFFTLIYTPMILLFYVGGIVIGVVDRIKKKSDVDFKYW